MPCFFPIEGFRAPDGSVTFSRGAGYADLRAKVACGRCIGCRLDRAQQWAVRCVHEASLHDSNCVITLTYDEDHLPPGGSLVRKDFQDFMKRLRRWFRGQRVGVFYCGEYGDGLQRPHFHACLFGLWFSDAVEMPGVSQSGARQWRSATLERLWPFGFSSIGDLNFQSAAYIARYSLKKVGGERAKTHYRRVDVATGEAVDLEPEFVGMSLRPAIAKLWFERFGSDVFPSDFVVTQGRKAKVPRYYQRLLKRSGGDLESIFEKRKGDFREDAILHPGERSPRRLADKAVVRSASVNLSRRDIS